MVQDTNKDGLSILYNLKSIVKPLQEQIKMVGWTPVNDPMISEMN